MGGFCVYNVASNRVLYETLDNVDTSVCDSPENDKCHCEYEPPSPPPSAPSPPSPPPGLPPPSEPPSPPVSALQAHQSNERLGVAWTEWDSGRQLSEAAAEVPLDISNCRGGIENIWEVRVTLTTDDQGERDVFAEYMSNDENLRRVDDAGTGTSYESCGLPVLVETGRVPYEVTQEVNLVLLIVLASLACCLILFFLLCTEWIWEALGRDVTLRVCCCHWPPWSREAQIRGRKRAEERKQ